MGVANDLTRQPYNLHPTFEAVLLYHLASDLKFWQMLGRAIEPECLAHPQARLVYEAVRVIVKDSVAPTPWTVLQRLQRLSEAGKLTMPDVVAVNAMFDQVLDLPFVPTTDAVANEMIPILKRRLQSQALMQGHGEWARHGDFGDVIKALEVADRLGVSESVPGITFGTAGFAEIERAGGLETLPTGIFEVDVQIQGLWRGAFGLWMARAGGGKSMALINQLSYAMRVPMFAGFVTLELPQSLQLARLYANITGIPINAIVRDDLQRNEARRRVAEVEHLLCAPELAEFPSYATTVSDLEHWIEDKEQQRGTKMHLLVVDFADRMIDPRVRDNNEYLMMRYVYSGLYDIAKKRDMWVWTASQAKRGKPSGRSDMLPLAGLDDAADSMHKGRIADMVLTSNITPEEESTTVYVAKHRMSRDSYPIGPIATDFATARMSPWTKELGNW